MRWCWREGGRCKRGAGETPKTTDAPRELTLEEEQALFDQEMAEANRLGEDAKYSKSTWVQDANENENGVDFTR